MTRSSLAIATVALTAAFALPVRAQDVLPLPEQPFKGHIGRTVGESTKDFPPEVKAPKDAPNILLILTDDVGFGASSTFGGPVPTPTMDRLANEGLRYTQFHTTALCSPTRAALLTGRNHHSAATGIIMEGGTGLATIGVARRATHRARCLLVADSVAKVADEQLRDNNGQQSNRKGLIFESTLRIGA